VVHAARLAAQPAVSQAVAPEASVAASARVHLASVPLAFEPLADGGYVARAAGETVAVHGSQIFLVPAAKGSPVATLAFGGASASLRALPSQPLRTRVSYFVGNDPSAWRHGIPTYARVTYRNLYPGIDITYYGTADRLEFDLDVAPGADLTRVHLSLHGAGHLAVDAQGRLVLHTGQTTTTIDRPVAYQLVKGVRVAVPSAYRLNADGSAGIAADPRDSRLPLVIDPSISYPTFHYSTLFGEYDAVTAVAADAAGDAYLVGWVSGQIITTTETLAAGAAGSAQDAFVAKLDPSGTSLLYSTYIGDVNAAPNACNFAIAVDKAGSAYITGSTSSTTFPITLQTVQAHLRGATDAFVAKLTSDGQGLEYSTYLGGSTNNTDTSGANAGTGIAVDGAGNAYVTGYTYGYNYPLAKPFQSVLGLGRGALGSQYDAFVTKLNASGSGLVYSTYLGGSGGDQAVGIAVDKAGEAYVIGTTNSPDFPTTAHARQPYLVPGADSNFFVTKFTASGTALVFSTLMGATSADAPHALAVDGAGNVYIAGETNGGIPQTAMGAEPNPGPGTHAFVMKMDSKGVLVYSTYLGGSGADIAEGIAVDAAGAVYIAGKTSSPAFSTPVFPLAKALQGQLGGTRGGFGMNDAFVTKISPCGTAILYSSYLGGTFDDAAAGIAVDARGDAIVAGYTLSPNFPLVHPLANGGTYAPPNQNAFVAMISKGPDASTHEVCPLPLTVDVPDNVNITAQLLTATIRTSPNAKITVQVAVSSSAPPAAGAVAPKPGLFVYRVNVSGTADAYGLYVARLQVKYTSTTALMTYITISVRSPHASLTKVIPAVLEPQ